MGTDRKVTIITPTYNAEKDIEACILSVAGQSYSDKEHFIVDGASTDGTLEIIKRYVKKYAHIKFISEKDNGIYDAMNKGIDRARGEWIYFLGCDDVFYDGKVLEDIFSLDSIDSFDVIYGNVLWGDTGEIYDGKFSLLKLMNKNICQQALFYRKTLFARMGKFDLRYKLLADHVFNMKWFNDSTINRDYLNIIVAKYGISGRSTTIEDPLFFKNIDSILKEFFPPEYVENYISHRELTYQTGASSHTISLQQDKIDELNWLIDNHNQQIHILNQQVQIFKLRVVSCEQTVSAIHNSLSWRLTSPLRKVHASLTGGQVALESAGLTTDISTHDTKLSSTGDIRDHIRMLTKLKLSQFIGTPTARLCFPNSAEPAVSVILVLYNKAEYTYQCLETLLANLSVSYELIIVDNASSDLTGELLNRLDNVMIKKNHENSGFLKACNQAADLAKGRWLLFLNNDTQVLPNLLATLVETGERDEKCGAVGGKLIFPDGKLQEAGSIIWNDGSCLGYGRDDNPDKGEYSYLREVDYCSGACLLVRRDLFEQIGRFDERYVPAYYEEVDLCMAVRQNGYKVVYQPDAKVIHYEFGSANAKKDPIDLQVQNRKKFVDKWQNVLETYCKPDQKNIPMAIGRYSSKDKRILVVDDRIPDPALGSGFPRTYELLKVLSELGFSITYYPLQSQEKPEMITHLLQQLGIEILYDLKLNHFEAYYKKHKEHFGHVWVSRPHNMECIGKIIRDVNASQSIIYDAEALFSMRQITKREMDGEILSTVEKDRIISKELDLVKYADKLVTVSARECDLISRYRADNVSVVSHVCEFIPTTKKFEERKDILFVGGFLTSPSPNEDSMLYFVKEIFPAIRQATGAKLWIVGTNLLDSIYELASEDVIVTGRVDDLRGYYDKCRVFVVPTRYAAGIPLKLVEALGHGIPAVVTPVIAEQLDTDRQIVLVGDGAADFAAKVISCYCDKNVWNVLRERSLAVISVDFSADNFRDSVVAVLN